MGKLLIIKTGSALPEMQARWGDFEDWTLARLGVGEARVVDVTRNEPLPDAAGFGGVVESAGAGAGGVAVGETDCVVGATVSSLMCGVFSVLLCVFICGVFCVLLLCFVCGGVRERLSVICGFGGLAITVPHLHPS